MMRCMPAPQSVLGLGVRLRCARASRKLPHYIIEPACLLIWSIFQMYYIIRVLLTKTTQNRAYQTIWVMCNARLRPFWCPCSPPLWAWAIKMWPKVVAPRGMPECWDMDSRMPNLPHQNWVGLIRVHLCNYSPPQFHCHELRVLFLSLPCTI